MCLRFQFCTHQRVCILYFLEKSNSLYPNTHTILHVGAVGVCYGIISSDQLIGQVTAAYREIYELPLAYDMSRMANGVLYIV